MSRTYRRKSKNHPIRRGYSGKSRNGLSLTQDLPPCYKNAVRMRCVASGATKWWFHSKSAAVNAAKYNFFNKINSGKKPKYERAYFCKTCGGYHLTTMNLEEWKVRKAELAELQGLELDENGNFTKEKPVERYTDTMD